MLRPIALWLLSLWFGGLLLGCYGSLPPSSPYPPSASDLNLLSTVQLCQHKSVVQQHWPQRFIHSRWGSGEQWTLETKNVAQPRYRWLFFSEDDRLVGAVFAFVPGLRLTSYPVLRQTLGRLTPAREFFLDARSLLQGDQPATAALYRTGDKTTTTQYVVLQNEGHDPVLLVAAFTLDPYEALLPATDPTFLRIGLSRLETASDQHVGTTSTQARDDSFLAAQQFARGETALFGSCGTIRNDVAQAAYQRALVLGLTEPERAAEAHYRRGLALRNLGRYAQALREVQQAIELQPNQPTFYNAAGTLLVHLDEIPRAIKAFEQAIVLKPNYARARFNLAEALASLDPQRAIEEYETYLSLVEGLEEEAARAALARERLRRLTQ